MSRFAHLVWLVLLCSTEVWAAAEKQPTARVGHAPSALAGRARADHAADKWAWQVFDPGDALPEDVYLRTEASRPCRVDLPDGTLHLGPDTRLRLKLRQRTVELESGTMFLQTTDRTPWTATVEGLRVALNGKSAAELTVESGEPVSVHVSQGSSTLTAKQGEPVDVKAGTTIHFHPADNRLASAPPAAGQKQQIQRWMASAGKPQGLGQLLIKDVQSGSPRRLNVARYHVHVVLQPPVALVQIDQSFYNPSSRQEEGTFVFNLPQGASVSRFAMYTTPTRLIEGELIGRQRAAGIYQSIVNRQRDPAILEQIGDNLFRMRVFPIFAKDTKRILLDYTLPLLPRQNAATGAGLSRGQGGEYRFRLPLFSDLKPIWDFRLSGTILGPTRPDSPVSRSHPGLTFGRNDDGAVTFDFRQQGYQPQTDFSLNFAQEADEKVTLRSYTAQPLPPRRDRQGRMIEEAWSNRSATYFLATVRPEPGEAAGGQPPPADVLILADTSSGMRGQAAVRRSVRSIVHNLRPADRFRLVCVDVAARPLHPGWLEPGEADAEAALARFQEEFCLGGTNLDVSLREALKSFDTPAAKRRRLVVYIGDGQDTLGSLDDEELPAVLARRLKEAEAALFGVVVGRDEQGQRLLESLARASGGLVFDLTGGHDGSRRLFGWLLSGVPSPQKIVRVEVEGAAQEDLDYPAAWLPRVCQTWQELSILGRTTATDRLRLSLTTLRGGKQTTLRRQFTIESKRDDVFLGRLWAQRKLDRLRRRLEADAADPDGFRQRIVALSQEWSLLSPHTAFLVLETEQDYKRYQIDRRQRRRYWKPAGGPAGVPLSPEWLAMVTPEPQQQSDRQRFARAIHDAREALAADRFSLAHRLLQRQKDSSLAAGSSEFAKLNRRALAGVQIDVRLRSLGPHHRLLDPTVPVEPLQFEPGVWPLLASSSTVSSQFLRRHPHAVRLLHEVDVPILGLNLQEFADFLSDRTGTNVIIDQRALSDVGLDTHEPMAMPGWGKMSLRNFARFALEQADLVMLEEPHRLLITTEEEALGEDGRSTEIYPVADLLFTDRVAEMDLLLDPYFDREAVAEKRIRAKLKRPMSVDFAEKPLEDVARQFAKSLGDTVMIDQKSLDDVGIAMDTPITARFNDVPAEESLRWMLRDIDLTYIIRHEALIILTREEAESQTQLRLHSGRGVVYEYAVPADQQARFGPWGGGGMRGFGSMGGMGGGFGGMGGMGGMGMGGGFFGGGMGGMFGGSNRSQSPFAISVIPVVGPNDGSDGFSIGGDPSTAAEESGADTDESVPEAATQTEPFETSLSLVISQTQRFEPDVDSVVEQITSNVAPNSWDEVGGPGSLSFFEPTLDFVISTTGEVHAEIESLFDRLRGLSPVAGAKQGLQPARVQPRGPDDFLNIDTDSLVELIMSTVHPDSWDEVGGPGSIREDLPRLALIISMSEETHDLIAHLLTMLRRSRFAALRSGRPWESALTAGDRPLTGPLAMADFSANLRRSKLPKPKPAELAALKVRRVPPDGQWKWRRVGPDGQVLQTISIRRSGRRMEIALPDCVVRTEGDAAAVAYPGLRLVEHGPWAEAIRQLIDAWMPWMPHRDNRELAQWFDVRAVDQKEDGPPPDMVRLRLVPPGFSDRTDTYLEATFSRKDGLLRTWQSYLHGKLTGRFRFADQIDGEGAAGWRTVVQEDPSGEPLMRWELVESTPKTEEIPALTEGFDGYVQFDRRSEAPAVDAEFHRALSLMQKRQWSAAVEQLDAAAKGHPQHPLLLLLRAWCCDRDGNLVRRETILAALREVAAGKATTLGRFIAEGNFPWLTAAERYEIVSLTPLAGRSAVDWDHLVRLATAAGRLSDALKHAGGALTAKARDGRQFERERIRVDLLLQLHRPDEAEAAVRRVAAGGTVNAEQLGTAEQLGIMAGLLAQYGCKQSADQWFGRALADERCVM